jgi:aspartyl-tRNA(Asn)/glutamyl-tRNA(Gln) amidotransferase subunit A
MSGSPDRVRACLERIDPSLGAFITVTADAALARAAQDPGGRLRGLVVAVKDLIDTRGVRTTYGTAVHADRVPAATAPWLAAMETEGAIVIGKTNLNELAYGVSGHNPHYGTAVSPLDRTRVAGGSSSGSAVAVAIGACDVALGTDTSGSVRIPAACCGVLGLKLAHRPDDLHGINPLAPSYDSIGYLARDVDVLRRVADLPHVPAPARVARVDELDLPAFPYRRHWTMFRLEAYPLHRDAVLSAPERYGTDLVVRLHQAVGDVDEARAAMARWEAAFVGALDGIDLVVGPVIEGEVPTIEAILREYEEDRLDHSLGMLAHTPIANALGWPALAVPTADGPRQILGRPGSEAAMLTVAEGMLASGPTTRGARP